jgi:outer membrane lipoprotein-sorting protein
MASNPLLLLILLLSALATVLAGMGVFSNSRPPDARLNSLLNDIDDMKGMLSQLQKSVLQTERKLEKEIQVSRNESREVVEKLAEVLDKRMKELVG